MDGENNGKPWKIDMEPTNLPKTYDICSMLIFRGVCYCLLKTKKMPPQNSLVCRYDINSCNYQVLRVVFSNNPTKTLRFWGTFFVYLFFEGNKPSGGTDRGGEPSLGKSQSNWWLNQLIWNRLVKMGIFPKCSGWKKSKYLKPPPYSNIFLPESLIVVLPWILCIMICLFLVTSGDAIPTLIVSHIKNTMVFFRWNLLRAYKDHSKELQNRGGEEWGNLLVRSMKKKHNPLVLLSTSPFFCLRSEFGTQ